MTWLHLATSPDTVAALDLTKVEEAELWLSAKKSSDPTSNGENLNLLVSTVDMRTLISFGAVSHSGDLARTESYVDVWKSTCIRKLALYDHLFQLFHQCLVLNVNISLDAFASDSSLLYTALVNISNGLMEHAHNVIIRTAGSFMSWNYTEPGIILSFVGRKVKEMILSHSTI